MVKRIIDPKTMRKASSIFLLLAIAAMSHGIRLKSPTGNVKLNSRVVGGEIAEEGFAPYQISLQEEFWTWHLCGGAIIDKDWILTASHCVVHSEASDLVVVTGTNYWEKPDGKYYVDEIHTHCSYDKPEYANDIALLHLNSSIVFNERTQPVPLPVKPMEDGDDVILTGWGANELWGGTPDELYKVTLKYVEHERCKALLNNDPDLDIGHVCTFTREGEGACHGDSGGPLISGGYLVGLVNWGYPCAIGVPDAHANVLFYRDWIRRVMSGSSKCVR